jgi:hypothetical protein
MAALGISRRTSQVISNIGRVLWNFLAQVQVASLNSCAALFFSSQLSNTTSCYSTCGNPALAGDAGALTNGIKAQSGPTKVTSSFVMRKIRSWFVEEKLWHQKLINLRFQTWNMKHTKHIGLKKNRPTRNPLPSIKLIHQSIMFPIFQWP